MLHWPSLLSLVIFLGCQPLDTVVNEGERLHKISILWRTHITINVATNHIRSLCAPEHVKNSSNFDTDPGALYYTSYLRFAI
ncbi:hypothetical protein BJX66DRAFT_307797 [Aspergillus keveii]|jgi:hypothetical protein|uniref:Secreted protein n=1 Tax=Aspergillus keveii TaxID=714993 RepID=A0ABR4G0E5_9EURO